jgi:hypothetical protein
VLRVGRFGGLVVGLVGVLGLVAAWFVLPGPAVGERFGWPPWLPEVAACGAVVGAGEAGQHGRSLGERFSKPFPLSFPLLFPIFISIFKEIYIKGTVGTVNINIPIRDSVFFKKACYVCLSYKGMLRSPKTVPTVPDLDFKGK